MMRCSTPSITKMEKRFMNLALDKADIGVGEYVAKFEEAWAHYNKRQFGVACNSGTNAIYLALKSIGIGEGDEVILPEYTMIATAWAVSYTGATPVFADCEDDLLVHHWPITKRTKAVITVPLYGREAPVPHFPGVVVIEDMAEAHGVQPKGDIACFSFYGNKILTTGEGGMCVTDNGTWANEMRSLANMYFDKGRTMIHPKIGHNFRMTNMQAAIGYGQVTRINEILKKRKQIEKWYDERIEHKLKMPKRDVLWMYDIKVPDNEKVRRNLEKLGIESRLGFKPMSMQPMYYNQAYKGTNAYKWSQHILYLPTWTDMTERDVEEVCQALNRSY